MLDPNLISTAVANLLRACEIDLADKDLQHTPQRVAKMWCDEFLAGYQMDPAEILRAPVTGDPDPDAVFITDLSFHAMCPHHLMPFRGRAHVAYLPEGKLLGFGKIAQLVACFTQRFTLQERATRQIAQALMDHLPARGAGCILEAEQLCLAIPGDRHQSSRVITTSFLGEFQNRPDLRQRLLAATYPSVSCPVIIPAKYE